MVIFFQRWDGNIIFSGHHCHRWFSNGFVTFRPSPLNVFSQVNHWKRWFFDGFPNFGYDGHRWFRSWKKGNIIAVQTFEIPQQFRLFSNLTHLFVFSRLIINTGGIHMEKHYIQCEILTTLRHFESNLCISFFLWLQN